TATEQQVINISGINNEQTVFTIDFVGKLDLPSNTVPPSPPSYHTSPYLGNYPKMDYTNKSEINTVSNPFIPIRILRTRTEIRLVNLSSADTTIQLTGLPRPSHLNEVRQILCNVGREDVATNTVI